MGIENQTSAHALYNFKLHCVFVTKYRRKTLTPELLAYLEIVFDQVLAAWRCKLLEFGGEPDHVHLLVSIHPALDISVPINNLKIASARRVGLPRFLGQICIGFYVDGFSPCDGAV
ncbi:IS200/IS605 family transposase [Cupriavidus necator]